jgi:copper chaperone CopZ
MVCPLCTRGVAEAIKRLPGVGRVTADLATARVEVEALDHHSLDIQQVRERAARAGFPAIGECDIQARGRFELGADRRLAFRPGGSPQAWQVLESSGLLALARSQPGLRGEFVLGFRLHDRPPWKRTSISITDFESIAR